MSAIQLTVHPHCQTDSGLLYQHVNIKNTATDGILHPTDLKTLRLPAGMIWSQGVVLEGRAPIWIYGHLIHTCHAARWVGCFDPRMGSGEAHTGGAVIVMTHVADVAEGDVLVVKVPDDCL